MNKNYLSLNDIQIKEEDFASIITMMNDGKISNKQVKDIFLKAIEENVNVMDVAKEMGNQISDEEEIRAIINEIFNENGKVVNDYKNGKNVCGFIMGLIMKKTFGKVNPTIANMILREELEKLYSREGADCYEKDYSNIFLFVFFYCHCLCRRKLFCSKW